MERRSIETPPGEVWFWAREGVFDGAGPIVLVIHGAFESRGGRFFDLEKVLPVSVVVCRLPGQRCPHLPNPGVATFAAAYSTAAAGVLGARLRLVIGESAGGLVAMAMDGDWPRLVLDPPLRSSRLWPAIPFMREQLVADPSQAELLWNVFGLTHDNHQERDYSHLVSRNPVVVMVGGEPTFPERPFTTPPSVVAEPERDLIRRTPGAELIEVPNAGHIIPGAAPGLFVAAVKRLL